MMLCQGEETIGTMNNRDREHRAPHPLEAIILGAASGAAGTTALDMTTYGDMALRGRSSSNMPAEVVRRIAEKAGLEPLDKPDDQTDDRTKNRRSALGALSGYVYGVTVGIIYSTAQPLFRKLPIPARALILGGLVMAATDVPATLLRATDPKKWGAGGWVSDIVPHFMYGLVTVSICDMIQARM